jgi:predicted DNA binding CopG/RHH family protein
MRPRTSTRLPKVSVSMSLAPSALSADGKNARVTFDWDVNELETVKQAAEALGLPYQVYLKQAALRQALADIRAAEARALAEAQASRTCPACKGRIPPDATVCPNCTYVLPFDQVATKPIPKSREQKQVRVNLLPYNLRWSEEGLEKARQVVNQTAVKQLADDGWEVVGSLKGVGTFVQGKTAAGPAVAAAVFLVQR